MYGNGVNQALPLNFGALVRYQGLIVKPDSLSPTKFPSDGENNYARRANRIGT
jgi:hypothetical protein